jgi:hypothetical protein
MSTNERLDADCATPFAGPATEKDEVEKEQ